MTTSIIAYRNPLDQWFWEGGYLYVSAVVLIVVGLFVGFDWWSSYRAKQRRKQRWLEMNESERAAWRYYTQRNGFESEEWMK